MFDYEGALVACARRDRQALRRLYDEEAGRLVAVAERIVRRREIAEDVVHDAFVQIWQKAKTYEPDRGSARGWVYAIVRNRALNVIRDGRRLDLVDDQILETMRDGEAVVSDAYAQLDETSRLRRCLEGLEPERRQCLLLAYVAGYTHGEIAGALRVPLGTAKSWVRRGLAALKECMA